MLYSKPVVRAILVLFGLLPAVLGFVNTGPLFLWSSQSTDLLSPSLRHSHDSLLDNIVEDDSFCSFDAILVIDHPGVQSSDLRTLHPSCGLAKSIKNAPSRRQLPNVLHGDWSSRRFLEQIVDHCGFSPVDINTEPNAWSLSEVGKHVLMMSMPPLEGTAGYRKSVMSQHERLISGALEKLADQAPKHVVVYSGSLFPLEKRQLPDLDMGLEDDPQVPAPADAVAVAPEGEGILHRYQLLTPSLIISLIVVLFIILPLLVFGISALASIQSPLRSEVRSGYDAHEKKVQ